MKVQFTTKYRSSDVNQRAAKSQVAAVYVVCMSIRQYLPLETYNLPAYFQKLLTWRHPAV